MLTRDRLEWVVGMLAVGVLLLLAALLWNNHALILAGLVDDIFVPWDAGARWAAGQISSRDFPSSLGPLYYFFHGLGHVAAGGAATAILKADVIALIATAPILIYVLFTRLPSMLAGMASLMLGLWMIAPSQADYGAKWFTHLGSYNRHGFVWLVLIVFLSAIRSQPGKISSGLPDRRLAIFEGALAGYLLILMLLTKVSFAVPGGLFFGAAILVRHNFRLMPSLGYFIPALIVMMVGVGFVELTAPGFTKAYISDLLYAGSVQKAGLLRAKSGNRGDALTFICVEAISSAAAIAAILLSVSRRNALVAITWVAAAAVAIGLSMVQMHDLYAPLIASLAIFLFGVAQSHFGNREAPHRSVMLRLAIVPSMALAISVSGLAVVQHSLYARLVTAHPDQFLGFARERIFYSAGDVPIAAADPATLLMNSSLGGVIEGRVPMALWIESGNYAAREAYLQWADARALAVKLGVSPSTRVLTLGFANAAPALLHTAPPAHLLPWWDPGRSFSPTRAPSGALDDVDLILEPKMDRFNYGRAMHTAYASVIAAKFVPSGESTLWKAWRRRPQLGGKGQRQEAKL